MLKIRQILYPTDFSTCANQALMQALFLAEQFEAELHMLHAIVLHDYDPRDPSQQFPEPSDIFKQLFEIADSEMANIVKQSQSKTFTIREAKVRGFSAGEVILDYADEHDIDLIVMGTHGRRGPARLFLGSVAEEVVRLAPCPVLTLREQEEPRPIETIETILVPIDFSDHSKKALSFAIQIAARYEARLQLLHTIEEPNLPYFYAPIGGLSVAKHLEELEARSNEAIDQLMDEMDGPVVAYDKFVTSGRPAAEIIRHAEQNNSDMIVISTHGLTGLERMLLGSTASEVLRHAECPVLTVKSFGKDLEPADSA
jgi:nucleotide-binding universal stress UspA family protein